MDRIIPWTRFFCNVHLFRVPRSWTGSVQMKSSMTFIGGNRCIEREREKDNFKSREVKRLKECTLALCGVIPRFPSYGVNSSKLVRFATCCSSALNVHSKNLHITSKLLTQGYIYLKLCKIF